MSWLRGGPKTYGKLLSRTEGRMAAERFKGTLVYAGISWSMGGAQVRRRDGLSAAAAGSACGRDYCRSRGGVPRNPEAAAAVVGVGRDLRVFMERAGDPAPGDASQQRLPVFSRRDCRESGKASLVGRIPRRR